MIPVHGSECADNQPESLDVTARFGSKKMGKNAGVGRDSKINDPGGACCCDESQSG